MEKIIEVSNLSYSVNGKKILDGLNFEISKGEFVSIIGPNGAGKTTLIKCLSNNLGYNGDIQLKDKNLKKYSMKEKARVIGVVPQEYNLPFNFKVKDIIKMGRNPYNDRFKKSEDYDNQIIIKSMHDTDTYQYKDRFYNSLSGGEKQRVLTARALAQKPEVLYLDEITSNLDIHNQLEILELIHDLNRLNGITVVSIMHDLNLAARFSDKILLLIDGKLEKYDVPEKVIKENILTKAYNMEMIVRENKLLKYNEVIPLRIKKNIKEKSKKIHIICGGGTGEYIIERLYSQKYKLSCGILYEGDSDLEICRNFNIDSVHEKPFSIFSEKNIEKNKKIIKSSDMIILTDVPIGKFNIENIKYLLEITDKKIIILHAVDRDYTNGEGDKIIKELLSRKNVHLAMNLKELFNLMEKE
jgi:iron complex transport system ATP-binding protein